ACPSGVVAAAAGEGCHVGGKHADQPRGAVVIVGRRRAVELGVVGVVEIGRLGVVLRGSARGVGGCGRCVGGLARLLAKLGGGVGLGAVTVSADWDMLVLLGVKRSYRGQQACPCLGCRL